MEFTVVVCTKNRVGALRRCLEAIFRIRYMAAWEILVVDNGSTDGTQHLLTEMARLSPVPFSSVVETRPGNSAGRNAALHGARGEVLFFTDDDCLVDPSVLEEMHKVFADSRVGYAGGRIKLYRPDDYPISIMDVPDAIPVAPGSIVYPGLVQGSNMAFRRATLLQLGGFDPVFGAGAHFAGEEIDLATRASMRGWYGGYFPGPLVHHDHGRDKTRARQSERQYDFGIGACYGKFLCDASLRRKCAYVWFRRSMKQLFRHPRGLPRQLAGALSYLRLQRQAATAGD